MWVVKQCAFHSQNDRHLLAIAATSSSSNVISVSILYFVCRFGLFSLRFLIDFTVDIVLTLILSIGLIGELMIPIGQSRFSRWKNLVWRYFIFVDGVSFVSLTNLRCFNSGNYILRKSWLFFIRKLTKLRELGILVSDEWVVIGSRFTLHTGQLFPFKLI